MNMKKILSSLLFLAISCFFASCSETIARKRCEYFATKTLSDVRVLYPNVKITDREVLFDNDKVFVCRYHYGTEYISNNTGVDKTDMYSQVYVYFVGEGQNKDMLGIYSSAEFQQAYVLGESINKGKALAEACRMLMLSNSREIDKSEKDGGRISCDNCDEDRNGG